MDNDRRWLAAATCAFALCLVPLVTVPAAAQPQRPCQDDIKKLCPDAKMGTPELRQCLKDNVDKLSEPCRQRINSAMRQRQGQGYPARLKGCETDLDKLCKGVVPGAGRLLKCLREHESDLSAECKTHLPGGPSGGHGNGGGAHGESGAASGDTGGHASGATPAPPTAQAK